MSFHPCIRCGKNGSLRCGKCKLVSYCSKNCQVDHWKNGHKGECEILSQPTKSKKFIEITPSQIKPVSTILHNEIIKKEEVPFSDYLFPPKRIQQMMNFRPDNITVGVGLYNAGNSCFLNSVLQCFTYTNPLANFLLSNDHQSKNCKVAIKKFCMLCELQKYFKQILYAEVTLQFP